MSELEINKQENHILLPKTQIFGSNNSDEIILLNYIKSITILFVLNFIVFIATPVYAEFCDVKPGTTTVKVTSSTWPSIASNLKSNTNYIFKQGQYSPGIDVVGLRNIHFISKGPVSIIAPAKSNDSAIWIYKSSDIVFSGDGWILNGYDDGALTGLSAIKTRGCINLQNVNTNKHETGINLQSVENALMVTSLIRDNSKYGVLATNVNNLNVKNSMFENNNKVDLYGENTDLLDVSDSSFHNTLEAIYTLHSEKINVINSKFYQTRYLSIDTKSVFMYGNKFNNATASFDQVEISTIQSTVFSSYNFSIPYAIGIRDNYALWVTDSKIEGFENGIISTGNNEKIYLLSSRLGEIKETAAKIYGNTVVVRDTFFKMIGKQAIEVGAEDKITIQNNIISQVGDWESPYKPDPVTSCKEAVEAGYVGLHVFPGDNSAVIVGHNTFDHIGGFASIYHKTNSHDIQVNNNLSAIVCGVINSYSEFVVDNDGYYKSVFFPYAGVYVDPINEDPLFCGTMPFENASDAILSDNSPFAYAGTGTVPSNITMLNDFGGNIRSNSGFAMGSREASGCID